MTSCHIFFLAATLFLFSSTGFASNQQEEAASLIEHAKQLSYIRADGAPAFRLRLDFKAIKKDGSVLQGTYTEVWRSKAQWRRETAVGDFHRTEVAAGQKRFLLGPVKALSEDMRDLPALSDIGRFQPETWKWPATRTTSNENPRFAWMRMSTNISSMTTGLPTEKPLSVSNVSFTFPVSGYR